MLNEEFHVGPHYWKAVRREFTRGTAFSAFSGGVCKPFSRAALVRGAKIEKREHPKFTKRQVRRIARDHLCEKGNRAYPKKRRR